MAVVSTHTGLLTGALLISACICTTEETAEDAERILKEYGQKHISTPLAKYYLLEHGETLLAEQAIKALAKTFR